MAVEYMSFEDVLHELQIDEEELKKLVSQGELRGFRDGMSMKFKKEDVFNLKKGRETEPTIILTDSDQQMGIAESSDELILDESTSDTVLNIGDIMSPEKQQEEIVFSDSTEEFSISPHDSDPEAAIPTVEVPSVDEDMGLVETDSDAALVEVKTVEQPSPKAGARAGGPPRGKAPKPKPPTPQPVEEPVEEFEIKHTSEMESPLEIADEEEDLVAPRKTQSGKISRSARLRAMTMKQKPSELTWALVGLAGVSILLAPGAIVFNRMLGAAPDWVINLSDKFRGVVELFV